MRRRASAARLARGEARAGASGAENPAEESAKRSNDLPEIAKKADDLEAIKKAVDDAAAIGGGLWISYLFVLFYFAVAAGAVTHADLFFEKPVKLPFLSVELPLVAFFFLAPLIFLVVHGYTLVHLVMLSDKVKRYHQALYDQIGDKGSSSDTEREERKEKRDSLRRQLPSNIFIQILAGPSDLRQSLFGWLLRAIAWLTLVIAPVLLLLIFQIQFLPFHHAVIAWTQRVALVADLLLLAWLWRKILSDRELGGPFGSWIWEALGLAIGFAVVFFSVAVVTFPGEWQEDLLSWRILPVTAEWANPATKTDARGVPRTASFRDWVLNAQRVSLHDWLFDASPDRVTRLRLPFSATLVLPGLNVYEGLGIDDREKAKWHDFIFRARGRDLRGAIFDFASLPKVDFEGADLQGASLNVAQLQGASLVGAHLQAAWLVEAQLQGASLFNAQLQGARLERAQLQSALLVATQFQGAKLDRAQLQGANLDFALLRGASIISAQLQGAWLTGTQLQGASLKDAQLQGASLQGAELEATDLTGAYLWRTNRARSSVTPSALRMSGETWLPEWPDEASNRRPWDNNSYQALLRTIIGTPSPGSLREQALGRIQVLSCSNSDKALASCDPAAAPPPDAAAWREALEAASVDEKAYDAAVATVLKRLVCSGGGDAIHILRGPGFSLRLAAAVTAASGLIDDLMNKDSKDCPVAAALTDGDRANLLDIKQATKSP